MTSSEQNPFMQDMDLSPLPVRSSRADYFFRMGSTHSICQDYVIAGAITNTKGEPQYSYALLSDGCSGIEDHRYPGSPYTDFGARFLVHTARRFIDVIHDITFEPRTLIVEASKCARELGLPSMALDASLIAAVTKGNQVNVYQTADGVIAARGRDGTLYYTSLHFGNNMPFYMSYLLSPEKLTQLKTPDPLTPNVNAEFFQNAGKVTVETGFKSPGEEWVRSFETKPIQNVCRELTFDANEMDLLLIMSDGVESFTTKYNQSVPLPEVLEVLFDFKKFAGEFVTRRCNNFLEVTAREKGWKFTDDFSIAGIHFS